MCWFRLICQTKCGELNLCPNHQDYDDIPEEFIEPEPVVDLSALTKNELLKMLPADIRETSSPKEIRRLTKQELINLIESLRE